MSQILEFEREMFLNVLNENSLTIASKGIAIDRLLQQLTRIYSQSSHLVFVIGCNADEEDYIITQMRSESDCLCPKRVTADSIALSERQSLYMSGGVVFVTSRILVVDMLTDRVPFKLISAIIVFNAHRIVDDCHQSFILRLYRTNNKTGFITALSQSPQSFIGGFAKLERIMRLLFVNKLFLWPRFHATVASSLSERTPPEVIEIGVQMTPLMQKIQFALMDLISMCIKELTNSNNAFLFESSELSNENVISVNFNKFVRTQFDPIWYQLSAKSRRIIQDIKLLKSLLFLLTQCDSVTFYSEIKSIRQNVVLNSDVSEWIFWDPSEVLFTASKERIFSFDEKGKEVVNIEIHPKWNAFDEIIKEIDNETKDLSLVIDVVVIVEDNSTARKLEQFRDKGADVVLKELYHKCEILFEKKIDNELNRKRKSDASKAAKKDDSIVTLTQMMKQYEETEKDYKSEHRLELHFHSWHDGSINFERLLNVLKPKYIILYEPDMHCIRQIELYQALHCSPDRVNVYFFIYKGSAEEQRYLKSLQNEKESFETLIKSKASMVIPADRDGMSADNADLIRGNPCEELHEINSRKAGGQSSSQMLPERQTIIVDMREFRSDLPSLIHKCGIDVEPITLEIGDYVLTPDTCVERKSVSDLIGSLNSGRLYHQTQVMVRYYKRSLLLIEFDDQKSFNFKGKYWGAGNQNVNTINRPNVMMQLIILTIQFPLLRLIWSPSPHFSAQVFEHLKQNKEQPKAEHVLAISNEQLPPEYVTDKYDIAVKDFLLCLPGVNVVNVYAIMNRVKCIADLVDKSIDELNELLGNVKNADLLYKALHSLLCETQTETDEQKANDKRKKRFVKKNKTK